MLIFNYIQSYFNYKIIFNYFFNYKNIKCLFFNHVF